MKRKNLHKVAPKLSEIALKKAGFEIPKNYFDAIEDAVIAEITAENFQNINNRETFITPQDYFDTLEAIVLAKLKASAIQNTNKTIIPKNYFDTIEDSVLNKIKTKPKVISLKNKFIKFTVPIGIAASLLLVFVLNNKATTVTFESLASSEIETWIDNGNIDIDALSIASIYPEIELTNEIYSDSLSDDEVLEYLDDEDLEGIIYEN